ncbi:MAG: DUF4011 domain-containing protein [Candidatus Dadabacteria bacterium]|nr:DUF4011 domain-containing protein [Candidatus Dadabacteria bacterium]
MMNSSDNPNSAVPVKIERLRNKLLDLSYRNPLLSTKLDSARNSCIRVVDELPDVLFSRLHDQGEFTFSPLPSLPLEENPADEEREEFQDRLAEAHVNDPDYIKTIEEIDPSDEDAFAKEQNAERELRDRIRTELGMSPRRTHAQPLADHALRHGISPHYDLPSEKGKKEHTDDLIQTLLLPQKLERDIGRLIRKNREWQEETGINVMHAAFGFLEWTDPASNRNTFSPLVLLPVRIEEKKTPAGPRLCVRGTDEPSEKNNALSEKLLRDFGIELPAYESNHSIEDYMEKIARAPHGNIRHWRVRRYIAFGVFPSMRLAMYNDLNISKNGLSNDIVNRVLGENQDTPPPSQQVDDYNVDDPSVESRVSVLLDRADSSQFSTMVEVAGNSDLAVEGPPGTGKSQTIVNVIGAALADGKKVLFVAEKMAALEVVRSRLNHLGVGEFALPLQPNRSSRRQVLDSLGRRLAMVPENHLEDHEKNKLEFKKVRDDISGYIDLISREYGRTSLTIHQIIGLAIRTQERLKPLSRGLLELELESPVDKDGIERIKEIAARLENDWRNAKDTDVFWSGLNIETRDKFTLENIRRHVADISAIYGEIDRLSARLAGLGFSEKFDGKTKPPVSQLGDLCRIQPPRNLHSLTDDRRRTEELQELLKNLKDLDSLRGDLEGAFRGPQDDALCRILREMRTVLDEIEKEQRGNAVDLGGLRENQDAALGEQEKRKKDLESLTAKISSISGWRIKTLISAAQVLNETEQETLSLRNDAVADPKKRLLIEKDIETGKELAEERKQLEEFFRVEKISDAERISQMATTLRSGGIFSFLSPKYRTARREYMDISKESGFSRHRAVERIVRLAQWASRKKSFLEEQGLRDAFGEYFRGVQTNFETLGGVLDYCRRVEGKLGYSGDREARDFLFAAPTDLLRSVQAEKPGWLEDVEDKEATVAELAGEIDRRAGQLKRRKEAVERFEEISAHLKSGNVWSLRPGEIFRLAGLAEKYSSLSKKIGEHPLNTSVEERMAGEEKRGETIEKNLRIAVILLENPRWTEVLRGIMIRGKLGEAEKCAEEFLAKLEEAGNEAWNLRGKSGIDLGDLLQDKDYSQAAEYLAAAARDEDGIAKQANYSATLAEMEREGVGRWARKLLDGEEEPCNLAESLEALIARALLDRINGEHPEILRDYSGERLDVLRKRLVKADKDLLESSRLYLRDKLISEARPPEGNGKGKVSTHTELFLVNREIHKKRRHIPLRDLVRRAGRALLELKPCWMMSPLAVAQYLPRDGEKFDLCIIDEASQMTPENAMGALMRAKQVMIVGDTNQLPPSNFFRKMISDEDADEDEDVLEESILEMANQAFPKRQLRWHYRSRDDRLIRYSNHAVYNNNLTIFPSPNQGLENARTGVSLVRVEGNYKSGTNLDEAKAVIGEMLRFMKEQPHRSLGVVSINKKQQELMEEQFQHARKDSPEAIEYIEYWNSHNEGLESFFIKNLESVQGDERDVIFISTVYGAARPGQKVAQRFGPINGIAGKRRLNVLFTRAKEQIVTFSSMDANDVTAKNPGTEMLKGWLEYCATGILDSGEISAERKEPESNFEAHVGECVRGIGCETEYQVGVGKYRIDIGVKHPEWPHGFLLGVECDGATYHSSRSARERDRYRQEILEGLGWRLHRIWSTNWFNDQNQEIEKLRVAINETLAEKIKKLEEEKTARPSSTLSVEYEEQSEAGDEMAPRTSPEEKSPKDKSTVVEVGDRIHIIDSDTQGRREILLTDGEDDPAGGTVSVRRPLGETLLGSELGEEVEFLANNRIHLVTVEKIIKV